MSRQSPQTSALSAYCNDCADKEREEFPRASGPPEVDRLTHALQAVARLGNSPRPPPAQTTFSSYILLGTWCKGQGGQRHAKPRVFTSGDTQGLRKTPKAPEGVYIPWLRDQVHPMRRVEDSADYLEMESEVECRFHSGCCSWSNSPVSFRACYLV